ncbi:MAG TPA: hypothetical protein VFI38_16395 [Candidatus Acidoferrum sp.]|nr:hypothetical protein [Candidatus Acidoferrum sp.]
MLKILLVEDDNRKLKNIVNALQDAEGCDLENIDRAPSASDAKRLLKETEYDLLILDIALPERPDKSPSPKGGIGLLKEILDRDTQYFRPKHIVGLTAFPDILTKFADQFAEDLWMVIQYEASSTQWAEQLRRKVEYIVLAERSRPIPEYGAYLGVVTGLQEPELAALLEHVPWGWSGFSQPADAYTYFKGAFEKDGLRREVIAVAAPRMGMTATAITAIKLISSFHPKYIAMVGISAGIKGACQTGDVIVADPSWDWGSGKFVTSKSRGFFQQAPHQIPLDSFLRGKLGLLGQNGEALDSIRRNWKGTRIDNVLRMHIGPVASGSAVLANPSIVSKIVKQNRKVLAIEMETYGLYAAANEASLPQPKAFSMKAVCDFADKRKKDDFQRYAAFTSVQALRVFVEEYL